MPNGVDKPGTGIRQNGSASRRRSIATPALLVPPAIHPPSSSALQSSGGAPPDPKTAAVATLPLNDCVLFSILLWIFGAHRPAQGSTARPGAVVPSFHFLRSLRTPPERDSLGCDSRSGWSALPRIRLYVLRSTTPIHAVLPSRLCAPMACAISSFQKLLHRTAHKGTYKIYILSHHRFNLFKSPVTLLPGHGSILN
jgi:hypothetical protein